jgi:hypothetical protein
MNITIQIQGGLGNQLFQYATGKALSLRLKRQLQLDIDWFSHSWDNVTPRHLLLRNLKISGNFIQNTPVAPPKKWRQILQRALPISPYVLKDRPYKFNSSILELRPYSNQEIYLMGYWQSFRYFKSIRQDLLDEIKPSDELSPHYSHYLQQIRSAPSAMVHIRRGDYIHLPDAARVHGFLGLEYYLTGIKILLSKNPNTHFFVFSDDLDWAKNNLPANQNMTFINSSTEITAPIQELYLMSQCDSHLIANSSLSWWGAWLCNSDTTNVIAPKNWTNDRDKTWQDLLPGEWLKI